MSKKETVFANGMFFNTPSDKAPDWVVGSVSFSQIQFLEWLQQQKPNAKGYVRTQVLLSPKTGKPYCSLDTYEPKESTASEASAPVSENLVPDEKPF